MKSAASRLKEVLERIEDELRRSPSFLNHGGKAVDDPEYNSENRRLEALQARLSRAIRELQSRPRPPGADEVDLLKYARQIEREMRSTWGRANTRNIQEILADATEMIHQYHEITATPAELTYTPERPNLTGSVEAASLFIFSLIAAYLQHRKKSKSK